MLKFSTLAREIKADTQEILNNTSAIKEDTAQILAEIACLQEQLPGDATQHIVGFMLERYLDNLTSYAETICDPFLDGSDGSRLTSRPASSGQESAIKKHVDRPPTWHRHTEISMENNEKEIETRVKTTEDPVTAPTTTDEDTKILDEEEGRKRISEKDAEEARIRKVAGEFKKQEARLAASPSHIEAVLAREWELQSRPQSIAKDVSSNGHFDQPVALKEVSIIENYGPSGESNSSEMPPTSLYKERLRGAGTLSEADHDRSELQEIAGSIINDQCNEEKYVVPQFAWKLSEIEGFFSKRAYHRLDRIGPWLQRMPIEVMDLSDVCNKYSIEFYETETSFVLEEPVLFEPDAKSDWGDEIPSANISTWEQGSDTDSKDEDAGVNTLDAIICLRRLIAPPLDADFGARSLQANLEPSQENGETVPENHEPMVLSDDGCFKVDDQYFEMDGGQKDHALSRASAALSRDCEVLGKRSDFLNEVSYDLGIEKQLLEDQIGASLTIVDTRSQISEALQRAFKWMREASNPQLTNTKEDQTTHRIRSLLTESMEHIKKQLDEGSSFRKGRTASLATLWDKEKEVSSRQQKISRDLGTINEAHQGIYKIRQALPNPSWAKEASKNRLKNVNPESQRLRPSDKDARSPAAKYFGKSSKITEWTASDLFKIPRYSKRYNSDTKAVRDGFFRIFCKLGIEFQEETNIPSPTSEVQIMHWFSCAHNPLNNLKDARPSDPVTFSIFILYMNRENTFVFRSASGGGDKGKIKMVIESIEAELKLPPAPFYSFIQHFK